MLSATPFECPPNLLVHAQQHPPLKTAVVNATTLTVMTSAKLATEHNLIEPILVGDSDNPLYGSCYQLGHKSTHCD